MKKYQSVIIVAIILIAIVCLPTLMYAPPFNPPDGGAPLGDPVGAPIDGGLSALIAGGIALIVRKFYKKKDKKS